VSNAISHNVPGGWVEIVTGVQAGRAVVSVANSGPMIPAAELGRLFEPFQRLGSDRAGGHDGLGLGLSIASAIISAHDAQRSAQALPGGGLEIQVHFPAIPPGLSTGIPPITVPHTAAPHEPSSALAQHRAFGMSEVRGLNRIPAACHPVAAPRMALTSVAACFVTAVSLGPG
jgi:hypothetical protein